MSAAGLAALIMLGALAIGLAGGYALAWMLLGEEPLNAGRRKR